MLRHCGARIPFSGLREIPRSEIPRFLFYFICSPILDFLPHLEKLIAS